jgi:hypothetical protein
LRRHILRKKSVNGVHRRSYVVLFAVFVLSICITTSNTFGAEQEGVKKGEAREDGECTEGDCVNGKGTKTFPDGTKYVGDFKYGVREGYGTYTYSDGGSYTGEWKDNMRHGKGTDTFANGLKYEGEWENDMRNGQGTLFMPDLGTYTGGWKDGQRSGQGIHTLVDGGKYEGGWKEGVCSGQGTYAFANGNKYVGEWEDFQAIGGWYYWPGGHKTWSYMDENWKWIHKDSKPSTVTNSNAFYNDGK